MRTQDIILSVGGDSVGTLPLFTRSLYMHTGGERVKFRVFRGSDELQLDVALIDLPHKTDKTDSLVDQVDPKKNLVRRLGILGALADLRGALDKVTAGGAVALLVERFGQLIYVSFLL